MTAPLNLALAGDDALGVSTLKRDTSRRALGLVLYLGGTFALTWFFWGLLILSANGWIGLPLPPTVLFIAGGMGPLVAAVLAAFVDGRGQAGRALLSQLTRWRVGLRWYGIALLGPIGLTLAAYGMGFFLGAPALPPIAAEQWLALPVMFLYVALLGGGLDEEVGWRGYLLPWLEGRLPQLDGRFGAPAASLGIGVIWAFWHVPLWFLPGTAQSQLSFPVFFAGALALSVILTWLYNSTGASLPIVILAHATFNVASGFLRIVLPKTPDSVGLMQLYFGLLTVLMIGAAVLVVFLTSARSLTRGTVLEK